MMFVLKALISTAFMATVAGLFFCSLIAVVALKLALPGFAFWTAEGFGVTLTLFLSGLFFVRAYNYERYGDAHKPQDALAEAI